MIVVLAAFQHRGCLSGKRVITASSSLHLVDSYMKSILPNFLKKIKCIL
ncbi:hypothetical protein ELI_0549 [Eubacterium callanderi]|uniref:Uncharacterized protein n=2 Tax=root TaxID=1 RepID=E3GIT0_9FIRM|nr:hypothetical protein ELI_0549 [Eubacterium callanderi]DAD77338.1 MAG TPA: hypothetical protein [Inoviridae sp. ctO6A5]